MLKKYDSFKEDLILESIINESIVYLSPKIKGILYKLKSSEIGTENKHTKPIYVLYKDYTSRNRKYSIESGHRKSDRLSNLDSYISKDAYNMIIFTLVKKGI